jgi:hypothetical protein
MAEPMGPRWLDARLLSSDYVPSTELPRSAGAKGRGAFSFIIKCIETPVVGVGAIFLVVASVVFGFTDLIPNIWDRDEKVAAPSRYLIASDEPILNARSQSMQRGAPSTDELVEPAVIASVESRGRSISQNEQAGLRVVAAENAPAESPKPASTSQLSLKAPQTTTVASETATASKTGTTAPPLVREEPTRTKLATVAAIKSKVMVRYNRPILRNGRLVLWHGAWRGAPEKESAKLRAPAVADDVSSPQFATTPLSNDLSPKY